MLPGGDSSLDRTSGQGPGSSRTSFGLDSLWASLTGPASPRSDGRHPSLQQSRDLFRSMKDLTAGLAPRELSKTSLPSSKNLAAGAKLVQVSAPSSNTLEAPGAAGTIQAQHGTTSKSALSEGCAQRIKAAVEELETGTPMQQLEAVAMLSALFAVGPSYRQYAHKAGVAGPLLALLHSADNQVS